MKRTASARRLLQAAEEHTVNGPAILARLIAILGGDPDAEATGENVARALSGRTDDLGSLPFGFDPEVAKRNA